MGRTVRVMIYALLISGIIVGGGFYVSAIHPDPAAKAAEPSDGPGNDFWVLTDITTHCQYLELKTTGDITPRLGRLGHPMCAGSL